MKFLVVTLAPTLQEEGLYYSYAPYVKEMNMWFDLADQVTIVSPTQYSDTLLKGSFKRKDLQIVSIPWISFATPLQALKAFGASIYIFFVILIQMRKADHIHLRCPGTISLIGCVAQIFFPKKSKTAKYAGNWDPRATQPLSYRIQKWILQNTTLTKNMNVLVYGVWPKQTKNIKSFFTASYRKEKILESTSRTITAPYRFLFVGSLSEGKRPLYALQLIEALIKRGIICRLDLFGDGAERRALSTYILNNNLSEHITLHGNKSAQEVEEAYKKSHLLLLPSKSEGWPKVVAEAMFWGVIPVVTAISCVPWMLNNESRGLLLQLDLNNDVKALQTLLMNEKELQKLSNNGRIWSHRYTLDDFENQIKELV
ncbi:glycosyltransferase family 4 protein [Cochleicola gelatinilyticus]|uniref:Glycosyl transferase n=1 Tax=Cochleicola gelatinilyticus TaxID=1763537 RepID=A0A167ENZ8_9FLAO|nr:glycosyltransferase family 4 protein [Cochleicola gelatinilyticus]OAB75730.1 glycosyl transferase [Cochleicola gelatinilyticus]